ncbi:MAG: VanW family protein [Defluviitaleaceae bacterium]|nr:VanW family protein [Defluviitaleaceae bacterium]
MKIYNSTKQPKNRSRLRLKLGVLYYRLKRYAVWAFGGIKFAETNDNMLTNEHFSHQTPLLRKLKDVDMQLQYNKAANLRIAVAKLNSVIIRPGETFSYWQLIGKPTRRKGYLLGMVLQNGAAQSGIGGGLCQLSNLIYWTTLHTSLTVVERHRHGYDVFPDADRTQPFGSGATCFYNYGDLMIKNNTAQLFQLKLEVTESHLKGTWMSDKPLDCRYEVYEKAHLIKSEYWGGYTRHNLIRRGVYNLNGVLIGDEFVAENHAIMMYSPLLPEKEKICNQ